jgi:hypothetical protein
MLNKQYKKIVKTKNYSWIIYQIIKIKNTTAHANK